MIKTVKNTILDIYHHDRWVIILMILNFFIATSLFAFSLIKLNPDASVVKIGYGDIGGYRDGVWSDLIVFPLLAILFGIFHNFLALRLFDKRGSGMTKFFLITTNILILGTFLVLLRLLGEG